jgi:hypothetical protein
MAMDLKFMKLKKLITKTNYFGVKKTVTDLSEPTLKPDFGSIRFNVDRVVEVTSDYEMRPDLISFWAYGIDAYADIILKANGISNPFSIKEGDVILIPNLEEFKYFYKKPMATNKEIEAVKRAFIDDARFSKPTEERLKKLQQLANSKKNGSPTITPSNKLKPGESAVSIKGGALIFAEYKSKQSKSQIKNGQNPANNNSTER